MTTDHNLSSNFIKWLIAGTLSINALAMFSPVFNGGDSIIYAALAQHIAQSGDWLNLVLNGQDWLDKPHLPFWLTALFFKLGGINTFSYILPGFLFHLIGAYYTYRMTRLWHNPQTAWLAVLIYTSIFNLMDASVEVKAETYLTGEIMAACYYWLRYDAQSRVKHLLLGAIFTAMAIMTKGLFTLITIGSGLFFMWLYRKQWSKLFSPKWLIALLLSFLFVAPEILALYLQFDLHPEKIIFGRDHVSGIRFFLWDSQFGRFFNSGPIQNRNGNPWYFLHVFLWAFLPWTVLFFAAFYAKARNFSASAPDDRASVIFLLGSFAVTFALFSATKFQLDYYIDIIFPFAAIFCAKYIADLLQSNIHSRGLLLAQRVLAIFLIFLAVALTLYVQQMILMVVVLGLATALIFFVFFSRRLGPSLSLVVYPLLAINLVFVFLTLLTALTFTSYGLSYNVSPMLRTLPPLPVYLFQMQTEALELGVYTSSSIHPVDRPKQLAQIRESSYLILTDTHFKALQAVFPGMLPPAQPIASMRLVVHKTGSFAKLLALAKGEWPLDTIDIVRIDPR